MSDNFALFQCGCPSAADANLHPYIGGVCPSFIVVGLAQDQSCAMIGFVPLDQAAFTGGTLATPTVLYRKYSVTGTYTLIQTNTPDPPLYPYQEQDVVSGLGLSSNYYDPTTGNLVNGTIPDSQDSHTDPTTGATTTDSGPQGVGACLGVPPGGNDVVVTSPTTGNSGAYYNFTTSSTSSTGTIAITLSDPDTAADAIARAAAPTPISTSDGSVTSIWETPLYLPPGSGGPALQFDYRPAKYALICQNLFAGLNYKVTVKWQKRTAGADGSRGSWVYDSTDVINFTAIGSSYAPAGRQYILNGTWVDANADGLIQASEVTPVVDLPLYQGYETGIASIVMEWVP